MSRISNAFRGGAAFIPFVMGGDPDIESTRRNILALVNAGADLIEIGIPFSDPVAEGPMIQKANARALAAGTGLRHIFDLVRVLRSEIDTPIVFLTYLNPVFIYGYDRFCARAAQVGVDGLIIPDLPFEEQGEILEYTQKYAVPLISLVSPTSKERIKSIACAASGFLYVVSSMGVTGVRDTLISSEIAACVACVREVSEIPVAVGFGIHTPEQAREIAAFADGVIVGSAVVRIIEEHGKNAPTFLAEYARQMKCAAQNKN